MARITVEDCLDKVDNRFDLVMISSRRARQLQIEGKDAKVPMNNDKPTVIALREIAEGLVDESVLDEKPVVEVQETKHDFLRDAFIRREVAGGEIDEDDLDDEVDDDDDDEDDADEADGADDADESDEADGADGADGADEADDADDADEDEDENGEDGEVDVADVVDDADADGEEEEGIGGAGPDGSLAAAQDGDPADDPGAGSS